MDIVAAKYKEYDGLRRPQQKVTKEAPARVSVVSKGKEDSNQVPAVSKRKEDFIQVPAVSKKKEDSTQVPAVSKKKQDPVRVPAATPQKKKREVDFLVPEPSLAHTIPDDEDAREIEPTPAAIRMQLGPTPQKDGHILNLFDSLSSVTPSKSRTALFDIQGNVSATPSKNNTTIAQSPAIENPRGSRTPASSGKRFMLDTFATPLKRKRDDHDHGHATPSSTMKSLATPAFLRRSHTVSIMETLAEEAAHDDAVLGLTRPRGPPFKRQKGFIRSLSSIIQGMRKQEDDALDEQMDIMDEMDNMNQYDSLAPDVVQETQPKEVVPADVVEESQIVMPLGPDKGYESEESSDEDQPANNGRKPWKKKGLKRQTKRVISQSDPVFSISPFTNNPYSASSNTQAEEARNTDPARIRQRHVLTCCCDDTAIHERDHSSRRRRRRRVRLQQLLSHETKNKHSIRLGPHKGNRPSRQESRSNDKCRRPCQFPETQHQKQEFQS